MTNKQTAIADIAVLGMAVMGKNLALNMADHGFRTAIYNRTASKAHEAAAENPEQNLIVCETLEELIASLKTPRRLFLMVKSGPPVDALIADLLPLLEPGDLIMDGGNSFFKDSQRRSEEIAAAGFRFLGVGVSGGESGARFGPAIMPGGDKTAYELAAPVLEAIAAKAPDGAACCAWMGEGGAGHYVKMVHNGIEYADMELIAELYYILHTGGLDNEAIAATFEEWNQGELSSYLSEITVRILREEDPADPSIDLDSSLKEDPIALELRSSGAPTGSKYLLDKVLDISRQKGTGKWTNEEGLELGVDLSILTAGLNARYMSMDKGLRVRAEAELPQGALTEASSLPDKASLAQAFLAARLLAYAQGFSLYRAAAKAYHWNLDYRTIAATFRGGCIIRSALLSPIMEAYAADSDLPNLLLAPAFRATLEAGIPALRSLLASTIATGLPVPAYAAALSYYDQLRAARSSANMISAQRDYFGAHTFQRTDREGIYHHEWPQTDEE